MYCGNTFCTAEIISVLWRQFLYCGENFFLGLGPELRLGVVPWGLCPRRQKLCPGLCPELRPGVVPWGCALRGRSCALGGGSCGCALSCALGLCPELCPEVASWGCALGGKSCAPTAEIILHCGDNFCTAEIISILWRQFLYCGDNFCTVETISVLRR